MSINFDDPKWNFADRVARLVRRGCTQEEAEEITKTVIITKEGPHDESSGPISKQ